MMRTISRIAAGWHCRFPFLKDDYDVCHCSVSSAVVLLLRASDVRDFTDRSPALYSRG